jgi:hypothetical protein
MLLQEDSRGMECAARASEHIVTIMRARRQQHNPGWPGLFNFDNYVVYN